MNFHFSVELHLITQCSQVLKAIRKQIKSTMFFNNLVNYVIIYLKSDVILGKYTVLYLISYHL